MTVTVLLVPLQFDTVIVPLPCISYVADAPPCGLINDTFGEVLHVKGPVPVATVMVICPPIQAVIGVAGNVGNGKGLIT